MENIVIRSVADAQEDIIDQRIESIPDDNLKVECVSAELPPIPKEQLERWNKPISRGEFVEIMNRFQADPNFMKCPLPDFYFDPEVNSNVGEHEFADERFINAKMDIMNSPHMTPRNKKRALARLIKKETARREKLKKMKNKK